MTIIEDAKIISGSSTYETLTASLDNLNYNMADVDNKVASITSEDVPSDVSIELNIAPEFAVTITLYAGDGYPLDYTIDYGYDEIFRDDGEIENMRFVQFFLE